MQTFKKIGVVGLIDNFNASKLGGSLLIHAGFAIFGRSLVRLPSIFKSASGISQIFKFKATVMIRLQINYLTCHVNGKIKLFQFEWNEFNWIYLINFLKVILFVSKINHFDVYLIMNHY
ncbi:hypothetical protein BpHYR1_029685 [Brachionus plicatilis]|uniref:Uncharacterized protein n=1 Tax=Brachionus plicatilis TaxID=10195 RepID=A0A3M7SBH0_BRAPC|nr:hypothetical protein BpHYR1_029685 [Brachionus plicatilis]